MHHPQTPHWDPNLHTFTIGNELRERLRELIDTARADLQPRNFAEHHLVEEMAFAKWRQLRVIAMQTAVYRHEEAEYLAQHQPATGEATPESTENLDPAGDMYFYALCHGPDRQGIVLAALARLETRYQRQFHNALRMLTALRRSELTNSDARALLSNEEKEGTDK